MAVDRDGVKLPEDVGKAIGEATRTLAPYDHGQRLQLGTVLFEQFQGRFPMGTATRSVFLLSVISASFPSERLSQAYFENLEGLLAGEPAVAEPGLVVLGMGPGRCGSTSLSVAFGQLENAFSTHENPPMIYWQPQPEQVQFHLRRFSLLAQHFSVVFDAAHWWLHVVEDFLDHFEQGRVVGLQRDMESCVTSFLQVKGVDRGTVNHWAMPDNGIWAASMWDPAYPCYSIPQGMENNHLMAKGTQIQHYVDGYLRRMRELATARPDRILLLNTASLDSAESMARLGAFIGRSISMPAERSNTAGVDKARQQALRI